MEWMYGEYGAVKIISVITDQDWDSTEVEPPPADAAPVVNVDEDMLQILVAGAHILRDEKNLVDHVEGVGLDGWGQQMDNWGERSTSTTSNVSVAENLGQIQWLQNTTVREYVHREGSDHRCYAWRKNLRQREYPWYRDRGWYGIWHRWTPGVGTVSEIPENYLGLAQNMQ